MPPEMVRDMTGRLIPWHLRNVFQGINRMGDWCGHIGVIEQELGRIGTLPCGAELDLPYLRKHLEAARLHMLRRMPYAQCDCRVGDRCEKCEGRRWLSLDRWIATQPPALPDGSEKSPN